MNLEVLIVDDDTIMLYLHKILVEDTGWNAEINSFENGEKAIDYLKQNPKSDSNYLVLLDINMPVMDGWEFLEEVKNMPHSKKMLVELVTSSVDESDREKAKSYALIHTFISKPVTSEVLQSLEADIEAKFG